MIRAGIGRCLPFSQLLTVLKVTPTSRASASWVRPRAARMPLTREGTSAAEIVSLPA